ADGSKRYLVYGTVVPAGQADAEDVHASLFAGGAWQAPIKLNDDPSCATHWHPAAVADGNGNLWAIWDDVRYGDGRIRYVEATASGTTLTIARAGELTDAAPPFTTSRTNFFLGDYIGLANAGGKLFATWGDLRELASGGNVRMYIAQGMVP